LTVEAGAAQNWSPLAGEERYGCIYTTFSTNGLSLGTGTSFLASFFRFALFTMLGIIGEFLALKEDLFSGSEGKFFTTRNTCQLSVYKTVGQNSPG